MKSEREQKVYRLDETNIGDISWVEIILAVFLCIWLVQLWLRSLGVQWMLLLFILPLGFAPLFNSKSYPLVSKWLNKVETENRNSTFIAIFLTSLVFLLQAGLVLVYSIIAG